MVQSNGKKWVWLAGLLAATAWGFGGSAEAGWGSYGSGGSWGSHGSVGGGWSSHGSHGSHGSLGSHGSHGSAGYHHVGPLRRLAHRWHARHSHHSTGGSWGSHGSRGSHGSFGSHGSHGGYVTYGSHGSSGSHGSHGGAGVIYHGYSVEPSEAPVPPTPPAEARYRLLQDGSVTITLNVPADARVFINDAATTSTGSERVYLSGGLAEGRSYRYTIRAEVERDGRILSQTEDLVLTPGERPQLALNFDGAAESVAEQPAAGEQRPRTTLRVRVPDDALVSVMGQETHQFGSVRMFHTDQLAADESWDGYTVKAVVVRNGQPLEISRRITLRGGESQELAFDFSEIEVAGRLANAGR